jgi:hypothetical protein
VSIDPFALNTKEEQRGRPDIQAGRTFVIVSSIFRNLDLRLSKSISRYLNLELTVELGSPTEGRPNAGVLCVYFGLPYQKHFELPNTRLYNPTALNWRALQSRRLDLQIFVGVICWIEPARHKCQEKSHPSCSSHWLLYLSFNMFSLLQQALQRILSFKP